MKNPHKHSEFIIAWANGETIQVKSEDYDLWIDIPKPGWYSDAEYRIKPKNPVFTMMVKKTDKMFSPKIHACWEGESFPESSTSMANLQLEFEAETGKLIRATVL